MTIAEVTAQYENAIRFIHKCPEHKGWLDPGGTHNSDDPDGGRVLKPGHTSQVCASI
jgi:hypothetical protein